MRIIAGEARGRIIEAPAGNRTRPTLDRVRENLFNMIQGEIPDSAVLDLFAGSGALSLEALSRGAASAVLVDSDRSASTIQKKNISRLRYDTKARIIQAEWHDALTVLRRERLSFDIVFLDPPYAMPEMNKVFSLLVPFVNAGSLVIYEHEAARRVPVPAGFIRLKERNWGYCGITIFRPGDSEDQNEEETN